MDLVEIAPLAVPPVCKLMDYGKFRYREQKKAHEAKLKQKQIQVKEVKFRPGTDEGDYQIKLRNLIRFFEEGDKVKITMRFRGREMAHPEVAKARFDQIIADLADVAGFWACAALLGVAYAPFVAVLTARGLAAIDGRGDLREGRAKLPQGVSVRAVLDVPV